MAQLFLINRNSSAGSPEQNQAQLLIARLHQAESFLARGIGLLSRQRISLDEALWIKPGNNVHTFFMKFAIDCIFVDSKLQVKKIYSNLRPFRFAGPVWQAASVIETAAGQCEKWNLKSGDQLYVVD